ncbi:cAMP-binding protein [Pasteurellaceae bacterium RH1A]|nr:cAMP-binding protein [Pasteurellaceae bacterium RH1A]
MERMRPLLPSQLTDCQLSQLEALSKGSIIYTQGDAAREFYFLQSGLVGLYHTLENGKESLVRLYHSGDYFGFRTLFGDNRYHCSAKVLQTADILRLHLQDKSKFLASNPSLTNALIQQLAVELQDAERRLAQTAYKRSYERVMETIVSLTQRYPDYPWTYREIAEFSGCETETAIRVSRELKKQGILDGDCRHLKISG